MRKLTVNKEGMSRLPKRQQQAKRVASPVVPAVFRHSGSSFGSAGYGSCDDTTNMGGGTNFYATTDTNSAINVSLRSNTSNASIDLSESVGRNILQSNATSANIVGAASSSGASQQQSPQTFIYHVQNQQPLTHKAAVYYHQQLALQEDQGIDLTQSPGRDSPGSSGSTGSNSRHSTASLDSGRASSYHTSSSVASKPSTNYHQYLNQLTPFNNSSAILSSPRCSSVSSCSIGSADQMVNRSDHEIIVDWLRELSMEEYAPLFSEAGYDMPTICRMTPEDLTAIGIKKPRHRERIKLHIDALQLPDNLPHYMPDSIEEWLHLLRLDEYLQPLLAQGYRQVHDTTQLPWEDMEDIGIVKLGHQKKLLLAIKRIKDILSGKWIASGLANSPQDCMVNPQLMLNWDHQQQYFEQMHLLNAIPSLSPLPTEGKMGNQQLYHQSNYQQLHMTHNTVIEKDNNDYVLIKLRQPRGQSIDSPDDSDDNQLIVSFTQHRQEMEGEDSMHVGGHYRLGQNVHQFHQSWRQYTDGDITPTNEMCGRNGREINTLAGDIDRDSLLRHRGMTVPQRNKPIAMVKGNVLHTILQQSSHQDLLKPCDDSLKKVDEVRSIAPDPPRRHSNSVVRPSSALDQICEDYDSMALNDKSTKDSPKSAEIHSYTDQVHNQIHSTPYHDSSSGCNQMLMGLSPNQQPIYANYNAVMNAVHNQQTLPKTQVSNPKHIQTRAEVHAEKVTFSNSNDSKNHFQSNSSIDSIDQLPFANDNAGTIKQRVNQYSQITHSTPNVSLRDSETVSKASNSSEQIINLSSDQANYSIIGLNNSNQQKSPAIDSNVLNDIGNMLANLTDELDAMLEEEKRAGLNDSE